jgi:CHAT domain-containing protein
VSDSPPGGDVVPVLREHRNARALALPAALLFCLVQAATALRPTLLDDGLGAAAAWVVTVVTVVVTIAVIGSLVRLAWTQQLTQPVPLSVPLFVPGLGVPVTASLYVVLSSTLDLPRGAALALACVGSAAMLAAVQVHVTITKQSRAWRLIAIGHPQQADELIAECREELLDSSLSNDERSTTELTIAAALAERATVVERYDGLPEAGRILARWLDTGDPAWVTAAAMSYAPAIVAGARETGDVEGLAEGLDLVARTLARISTMIPMVRRELLGSRSDGLMLLHTQADADGDEAAAARLHTEAIAELDRALELTHRGSAARATLMIDRVSIAWNHPQHGGVDAAIVQCRKALRGLRLQRLHVRENGCFTLADLLAERAPRDGTGADIAEALALCELVADKGRRRHQALGRIPTLLELSGADEAVVAHSYRRAFTALCAVSFDGAGELAVRWGSWAESRCFTTESAEAHLCWVRIVVSESRRLRLRGDDYRPPWDVQLLTADAGFWLLAAGRARDAALALDLGAGVPLSERMHRDRGELAERLAAADRDDLGERWREIGERLWPMAQAASDARRDLAGASVVRVGGQSFRGRFASRDYVPLADHDQLVREISRVPGFEDVDASPTYEDLREAARDGPLVYLAASAHSAFAVIVTEGAPEPEVVVLPGLTGDEVWSRARRLVHADGAQETAAALESTLPWLWDYAVKPLAKALPTSALVTLIPIGALGLLPIHAAAIARRASPSDPNRQLVFRYAPNARLLARAQTAARAAGGPELPIADVAVGQSSVALPLAHAAAESHAVAALFGADLVRRPASGRVKHVCDLLVLGDAAVWHLACRVEHDPLDPLASRLLLADGRLSLRDLLAPEREATRLAVLPACRTAIAGQPDLDELVSLPASILHAGVAGVVSSPAVADERGAALLMLAFLQRFLDGTDPARALAEAQAWLANATNRELRGAFGAVHAPPQGMPATMLRPWERERAFAAAHSWALFSYWGA